MFFQLAAKLIKLKLGSVDRKTPKPFLLTKPSVVLGIDPGDTTGWIVARISKSVIEVFRHGEARYGPEVRELFKTAAQVDYIVIEDFTIRQPLIGSKGLAMRVVGGFELHYTNVILQQPSERKRCTDELLKSLGMFYESRHTNDAIRHVVVFAEKRYKWRPPRKE